MNSYHSVATKSLEFLNVQVNQIAVLGSDVTWN